MAAFSHLWRDGRHSTGRFHGCDCWGTRFEIYPPSVAMPSTDDKGGPRNSLTREAAFSGNP